MSHPKSQIWILAALTLPYRERIEAMNDIADMLGTTYAMVQSAATKLKVETHAAAMARRTPARAPVTLPSALRQPTRAQMMGGR